MTVRLFYQKYDYITKLSTIVMNFNVWLQLAIIAMLIMNFKYFLCM